MFGLLFFWADARTFVVEEPEPDAATGEGGERAAVAVVDTDVDDNADVAVGSVGVGVCGIRGVAGRAGDCGGPSEIDLRGY